MCSYLPSLETTTISSYSCGGRLLEPFRDGEPGSESDPEGGEESSPADESYRDIDVSPTGAVMPRDKEAANRPVEAIVWRVLYVGRRD